MQEVNKLIEDIIATIKNDTSVETLEIARDTLVEGRTCEHRVDLYWKFKSRDIVYQALIDTSHYNEEKISKKMLFQAFSAANDINGQVVGVLLTKPIMDPAVKDLAEKSRIVLCEVGEGIAKQVIEPTVKKMNILFDREWIKAEKERLDIVDKQINFKGNPKYLFIYDEEGNCIDSLEGVVESILRDKAKGGYLSEEDIEHLFAAPTYLKIDDDYFPQVKILGLVVTAEIKTMALVGTEDVVNNIRTQVEKQFLQ